MLNTPIGHRGWLGNPFPLSEYNREESCNRFQEAFLKRIQSDPEFREAVIALKDQALGCYCHPLQCHGHIIAEYLDSLPEPKPKKKGRR
jgi:hypothetical protein